jgi:Domain of unknown function (DUF397)
VDIKDWRKSSFSIGNGACVEAGSGDGGVGVRDSKLAKSPVLKFGTGEWKRWTGQLKADAR